MDFFDKPAASAAMPLEPAPPELDDNQIIANQKRKDNARRGRASLIVDPALAEPDEGDGLAIPLSR